MNFEAYRKSWADAVNVTPELPLHIDIELSAVCNLKCPFCFLQADNYKPIKQPFMSTVLARGIIEEAYQMGIPAIKVNWRGEPTLHPKFNEIIKFAGDGKFLEVLVNTNGNYEKHINYGLMSATKVMFSLDSMEEDTYKVMRPNGNLKRVLTNVNSLIQFGHRNIWLRRVLTDSNRHEDFKSSVAQKFSDKVKVAEHCVYDRVKTHTNATQRAYCGYPSQRLVVATNGDVFPCCVDYSESMPLGNVAADSIEDMWHGKAINTIREQLKKHECYNACKDCTSWMAYNAPEREKVMDKEL